MKTSVYPLLAICGIVLSSMVWSYLLRNRPAAADRRLFMIYLSALIGAMLGAKVVYIASEGWLALRVSPIDWKEVGENWLVGKSILGALLGGYAAVEISKKMLGYTRATGDLFAVVAPLGLMLGRIGCLVHGCCLGKVCEAAWYTLRDTNGIPRWPAVPLEFGFNAIFFLFALICWRKARFRGQLFHIYLMAYGIFRFAHEVMRDTPKILGSLSGYQIAAAAVFILGCLRYVERARSKSCELEGFSCRI